MLISSGAPHRLISSLHIFVFVLIAQVDDIKTELFIAFAQLLEVFLLSYIVLLESNKLYLEISFEIDGFSQFLFKLLNTL